MENTKPDGGPAFPREDYQTDSAPGQAGMTLRDYFAAKALPVAFEASWGGIGYKPMDGLSAIENNARLAYWIADAMIAARSK